MAGFQMSTEGSENKLSEVRMGDKASRTLTLIACSFIDRMKRATIPEFRLSASKSRVRVDEVSYARAFRECRPREPRFVFLVRASFRLRRARHLPSVSECVRQRSFEGEQR